MATRRIAAVSAALMLGGCTILQPPAPQPVRYACNDGRRFAVTYHATGESATIELRGMRFDLRREPSGSGARYACDVMTLHAKGNDATVEMQDAPAYTGCREISR